MKKTRFILAPNGALSFLDKEFYKKFGSLLESFKSPLLEKIGDTFLFYDREAYSELEITIISDFMDGGPCLLEEISSEEGKQATLKLIEEGLLKEFDPKDWKFGYGWQSVLFGHSIDSMSLETSNVIAFNVRG